MANWWFVPAAHRGTYREWQRKLSTFNARSDKIAGSSTFRKAFATRRCLVPASGWYEWTSQPNAKKSDKKTKWRFFEGDHEPIFFAGIWDRFENTDPEDHGPLDKQKSRGRRSRAHKGPTPGQETCSCSSRLGLVPLPDRLGSG
jgi:putative SOS response-associated peptidase YedK